MLSEQFKYTWTQSVTRNMAKIWMSCESIICRNYSKDNTESGELEYHISTKGRQIHERLNLIEIWENSTLKDGSATTIGQWNDIHRGNAKVTSKGTEKYAAERADSCGKKHACSILWLFLRIFLQHNLWCQMLFRTVNLHYIINQVIKTKTQRALKNPEKESKKGHGLRLTVY